MEKYDNDVVVKRWRELYGDLPEVARSLGVEPAAVLRYLESLGVPLDNQAAASS